MAAADFMKQALRSRPPLTTHKERASAMLSKKDFLFDKRLTDRFLSRHIITRKQHEEYLARLPDTAGKSEPLVPLDEPATQSSTERDAEDKA